MCCQLIHWQSHKISENSDYSMSPCFFFFFGFSYIPISFSTFTTAELIANCNTANVIYLSFPRVCFLPSSESTTHGVKNICFIYFCSHGNWYTEHYKQNFGSKFQNLQLNDFKSEINLEDFFPSQRESQYLENIKRHNEKLGKLETEFWMKETIGNIPESVINLCVTFAQLPNFSVRYSSHLDNWNLVKLN